MAISMSMQGLNIIVCIKAPSTDAERGVAINLTEPETILIRDNWNIKVI